MARGLDDGRVKTGLVRAMLTAPMLAPPVITVPPLSDAQATLLDKLLNSDIVAQGL